MEDLQYSTIVPLDYFQEAFLPPLLQIDLDALKASLTKDGVLNQVGRWTRFPNNPAADPQREEPAFELLEAIFNDVIRLAQPLVGRDPTLEFRRNPTVSTSSTRTNTSRPDAYMLLVNKKSVADPTKSPSAASVDPRVPWDDIAVSFEYKKQNGHHDRDYNNVKIIWSLHQVMRRDPCRRATSGVTIEDTQTRFWFTCRSATIVSEAFNFIEDTTPLIHFFCALAFAEDHEQGWDPTCRRVWDELFGIQYDIEFRDTDEKTRVYRTTRVLSDFGAEALRGRGTRVFEAYLTGGKEEGREDRTHRVAIKDAWRESDRLREDQILRDILQDVEETKGPEKAKIARKYFLTVRHTEDVQIDGMTDHTLDLLFHGHAIPPDCSYIKLKSEKELSHTIPTSTCGTPVGAEEVRHKIHFRIVFEEVCIPVSRLNTLAAMFKTLYDAAQALKFMHDAGWVHRDVSVGNVLHLNGEGKLADLEYARKKDTGHEVCTGTVDFMACEVEVQEYLFSDWDEPPTTFDMVMAPSQADTQNPKFHFNPLHDLESLLWIAVWILFYHTDKDNPEYSPRQRAIFNKLFPGTITSQTRASVLRSKLDITALPQRFQPVCRAVEGMRKELVRAHHYAQKNFASIDLTPLATLQEYYFDILRAAYLVRPNEVHLSPPSAPNKRRATQESGELDDTPSKRSKRSKAKQ